MRILLLILFGAAGTLARYALQGYIQVRAGSNFPSGTLVINLSGCFLLGLIGEFSLRHLSVPPDWRIAMTIGFLGGFTTFSSFAWEAVRMLEDGEWIKTAAYLAFSVFGGLLAVLGGIRLAERI